MEKYLAREFGCRQETDYCETSCKQCKDCQREARTWSDCWSACDVCNTCYATASRQDLYSDAYNYRISNRTIGNTPALSKQFCDNICGRNMCEEYRARRKGYQQCGNNIRCQREWGCPNPNGAGAEFGYRAPIDPMYTDCVPCWK